MSDVVEDCSDTPFAKSHENLRFETPGGFYIKNATVSSATNNQGSIASCLKGANHYLTRVCLEITTFSSMIDLENVSP